MCWVIDKRKVRALALSNGSDDWFGCYELIWRLNDKYPEASPTEKLEAARSTLIELHSEGLIDVYFVSHWPPRGLDDFVLVERSAAALRLAEDVTWSKPADALANGSYYAYAATDAGKKAYLALPESDFVDI